SQGDGLASASSTLATTATVALVDNPPTVSISSPAESDVVSGTVTITADANDDVGVSQVEFFDGSTSIGIDTDGSNGWSVDWDTSTASNGGHALTAVATDTAAQPTTSAPVNVTVP